MKSALATDAINTYYVANPWADAFCSQRYGATKEQLQVRIYTSRQNVMLLLTVYTCTT